MSMESSLRLPAARAARGDVRLPGSKSISNRVLLLAALAQGTTRLDGLLDSDDTRVVLAALRQLGVAIDATGPAQVDVHGAGGRFPQAQGFFSWAMRAPPSGP